MAMMNKKTKRNQWKKKKRNQSQKMWAKSNKLMQFVNSKKTQKLKECAGDTVFSKRVKNTLPIVASVKNTMVEGQAKWLPDY